MESESVSGWRSSGTRMNQWLILPVLLLRVGYPDLSDGWTTANLSRAKPDSGAKWAEVIRQIGEYCVLAKSIGNIRCAFQAVITTVIW